MSITNTSMDCKLYGVSIIFLSSICGAPTEKQQSKPGVGVCYNNTKCGKQPPCRVNKQGGMAEIKAGCCVALLLAEPFSPWQRGAQLSFGNAAQPFFTA